MSIFSSILNKIFPQDHPAASSSGAMTPPTPSAPATAAPASGTSSAAPAAPATSAAESARSPVTPMPEVDVDAILSKKQQESGQSLNWRASIVDLMKLLGLDSSLDARKELAKELNYDGSTEDSAAMNVWLHRAVMRKLAQNGGRVPDDLK